MSEQHTIIGFCENKAHALEAEAARWAAMADVMRNGWKNLSTADRIAVQELLDRIPVEASELCLK